MSSNFFDESVPFNFDFIPMSPTNLEFAQRLSSEEWYHGSLSQALDKLYLDVQGIAPDHMWAILRDTYGNVFMHELNVHETIRNDPNGHVLDALGGSQYVKLGYYNALQDLVMTLYNPGYPDYHHPIAEHCRERLVSVLESDLRRG
ncbi:hypothetical protein FRC07_009771 [Ceratobasidium sp. 392]|nr:hypothetical protein FRC07_009771 [Ceratobasidium sp. 392]